MKPIDRYDIATRMQTTALTERIEAAADMHTDPNHTVEALELLRATLHRQVDEAIDNAQVNRPSATRPVLRTRRHHDLSL